MQQTSGFGWIEVVPSRASHARWRRRSSAATAVVALLGLLALTGTFATGGASAAARWSAPGDISSPTYRVGSPSLAFDRRGRALAAWSWYRSTGAQGGWRSATRAPGRATAFAPERWAPPLGLEDIDPLLSAPVLFGSTRALAIEQRGLGFDARCNGYRFSLAARFGRSDGVFGAADPLARVLVDRLFVDVTFAANDRGDALAAWSEIPRGAAGCGARQRPGAARRRRAVRVVRRSPGSAFGVPTTLWTGQAPGAVVASVGSGGDMLVAWQRAGLIEARYRRSRGRWGRVLRVAKVHVPEARGGPLAAVTSDGRAYLVWTGGADGRGAGRRVVRAASLAPGARRFSAAQTVDRAPWPGVSQFQLPRPTIVRLRLAPGGERATLAWTAWDGSHWRARVAETGRGGRFTSPVTATPGKGDYAVGDAAVSHDGRIALGLESAVGGRTGLRLSVAVGSARGAFAAPEQVATGDIRSDAVAASPVTSGFTVAWAEVTTSQNSPSVIRSATRMTPG